MGPLRGSFRPILPGFRNLSTVLAGALVVGSALFGIFKQAGSRFRLDLVPALVWPHRGGEELADVLSSFHAYQLWQPFTYMFVEKSAWGVIFGAMALWSMGGALEPQWGTRRYGLFALGVTFLAGLLTVAASFVLPQLVLGPFAGGWTMAGAVWVAYGLSYGSHQTNFWGIPLSGNMFALVGVGFIVLSALLESWVMVVPDAFAIALTYAYLRLDAPRLGWLRFQNWRLQRRLKGRTKHLRLISKDRNTPSDSDRYLH